MDSVNILIDYFNMFKMVSDNKVVDSILKVLNGSSKSQFITDFDKIVELVKNSDISSIKNDYLTKKYNEVPSNFDNTSEDNILYDVLLNIIKYNNNLSDTKVKKQGIVLNQDISFDNLDVNLKDILNYLDIHDGDIDKELLDDLSKLADLDKLKEFSTQIKTDTGMRRVLFDKIEDKNILMVILLHSNLEIVDNVIKIFEHENANINKVVNNIPSIFIKDLISSKCKYNNITTNYENFVRNYKLIKDNDISFKKMLNQPVFLINNYLDNQKNIEYLESIEG